MPKVILSFRRAKGEQQSLVEEVGVAESLDLVEGRGRDEGEASVLRHMMDQKEDKSALDKAEQEQVEEQVLLEDWQTAPPDENEERWEDEKGEKERSNSSRKERGGQRGGEGGNQEGEFSLTFEAAQGAGRQEFAPVVVTAERGAGAELSL